MLELVPWAAMRERYIGHMRAQGETKKLQAVCLTKMATG